MPSLAKVTIFWLFKGLLLSFFDEILSLKEANKYWNLSIILIRWNLKMGGFSVDANRLFFVYIFVAEGQARGPTILCITVNFYSSYRYSE